MKKAFKKIIISIYKQFVPLKIRDKVTMYRDAGGLNTLRKEILKYYNSLPKDQINHEEIAIINFLKKSSLKIFPYAFPKKYKSKTLQVYLDKTKQLHYIYQGKKKLYFKRSWTRIDIKNNYNNLLIEQDEESPHRYLTDEFNVKPGGVVIDVGSAEGIFALSVVEEAGKIYLFETDSEWIEALLATFAPWSYKVQIVNKFVSNLDDGNNITLNSFFEENQQIDFIKIDVDGAEFKLLKGASKILNIKSALRIAICTYHKQNDEQLFTKILKDAGFEVSPSKGYMIFIHDTDFKPPFLRRGILRAEKLIKG